MKKTLTIVFIFVTLLLIAGIVLLYKYNASKRVSFTVDQMQTEICENDICGNRVKGELEQTISYSILMPNDWKEGETMQSDYMPETVYSYNNDYATISVSDTAIVYDQTDCQDDINNMMESILEDYDAEIMQEVDTIINGNVTTQYGSLYVPDSDEKYVWYACSTLTGEKMKFYFNAYSQVFDENNVNDVIKGMIKSIEIAN